MLTVLDVSDWQAAVDFERVAHAGVVAVVLRKAEGLHLDDPDYTARHRAALAAGLYVGAYFFAHPEEGEPELQADHFARDLELDHARALRPMLDYEISLHNGGDEQWVRRFNHRLLTSCGVGPGFYSYPALIEQMRLDRPVGWGLWLAAYYRNDGSEHAFAVPAPWKHAIAHQFSSRCTVTGCAGLVDLSHAPSIEPLLAHPDKEH